MKDYYIDWKKKKKLPITKSDFSKALKQCSGKKGKKFDACILKKCGVNKKKK